MDFFPCFFKREFLTFNLSIGGIKTVILSFYFYKGLKHKRIAIQTIHSWPTDWINLKGLLNEVAIKIWHEHNESQNLIVSLERHLPGKYTVKWKKSGYNTDKIPFRRSCEFSCKISFNPLNRKLRVREASFGPHLMSCLYDYRSIERELPPRVPPVLPKESERATGDLRLLLVQPSNSFHADYSRRENLIYGEPNLQAGHTSYQKTDARSYLPKDLPIVEEGRDKADPY
jgi:hypothetical protein